MKLYIYKIKTHAHLVEDKIDF